MSGMDFRRGVLEVAIEVLKFRINYISMNDLDCDPEEKRVVLKVMVEERKRLKEELRKLRAPRTVVHRKFEVVV